MPTFLRILLSLGLSWQLAAVDYTWTGSAGPAWTNAGSWTPKGVPGPADRAVIAAGTPTFSGTGSVLQLELNGGVLQVEGSLSVAGTFNWSSGTLAGAGGTTTLEAGAVLNLTHNTPRNLSTGHRLLNRPTGLIRADNSVGGSRTLSGSGTIENWGTILVETNVSLSVSGDFRQHAGVVRGEGEVVFQSGSFDFHGGRLEGTVRALNAFINVADTVTEPSTLHVVGQSGILAGNASPAVTLWIEGRNGGDSGHAFLRITNSILNRGTLLLQNTGSQGYVSRMDLGPAGVLINTPSGVLRANASPSGGSSIVGVGRVENSGTVVAGTNFTLSLATAFRQRDGVVRGDGEVVFESSSFDFQGGRLEGTVRALNAFINVADTVTEPSTLHVVGQSGILAGNASPAVTLWIEGRNGGDSGHAFLRITNSILNRGTLLLQNTGSQGYVSRMDLGPAGVLINTPSGVLRANASPSGGSSIVGVGRVENSGTVVAGTNFTLTLATAFRQRDGVVRGEGEVVFESSSFDFEGGRLEGTVRALNAFINVADTVTEPSTLHVVGQSGILAGNASPAVTLWIEGRNGGDSGHAFLSITNPIINRGTLLLQNTGSQGYVSRMDLGPAGVLINATNGVLRVNAGPSGGSSFIGTGTVTNQGLFELQDAQVTLSTSAFVNAAGGVITGTGTLEVGPNSFANLGTVRPGTSPGVLKFNGGFRQGSSGRLELEIGGSEVGTGYDQLAVQGPTTLAGTLAVRLLEPFIPTVGNTFRVVSWASRTGEFTDFEGLMILTNQSVLATYAPGGLDLIAVAATNSLVTKPTIAIEPADLTLINGQTATFQITANGTRPLHYQWFFKGLEIPGAHGFALTLPHAQTNQSGGYHVVVTNSAGSVASRVATLNVRPVADLVIQDIVHPADAVAGEPITVSWRSLNQGSQSALSPWTETVALSTNASGLPRFEISSHPADLSLESGQSVNRTPSLILPAGLQGRFYVVVTTDVGNQVVEEVNEGNNVAISLGPIQVRAPDLQVSAMNLKSAGGSPLAAATFGQSVTVSWTTTNTGTAPVFAAWKDSVYLAPHSQSLLGATQLATRALTAIPLSNGSGVSNQLEVVLPLAPSFTPGDYFILVAADSDNAVAESAEANNLAAAPITLTLPPLPDLVVSPWMAPAQASPGQILALTWTVTNRGSLGVTGAWTETLRLTDDALGSGGVELGSYRFTNSLVASGGTVRTQSVTVPIFSPTGPRWFSVTVDSRNDIFEQNEANNLGVATTATTIPPVLTLQPNSLTLREDATQPALVSVTRNGDRSLPLMVTLESTPAGAVSLTQQVVIPAGQASITFSVRSLADGLVTGSRTANITANAPGFASATVQATVLDSDRPRLTLHVSEEQVREGLTLAATVTRDAEIDQAATVTLGSSNPGQLLPPISVNLAAGQASASFALIAIDDALIESPTRHTITATAPDYSESSAEVTVADNDLPVVTLTLSANSVSENAGAQAVLATVARDPVTLHPVELELENSQPNAASIPARITIRGGAATATFSVGVRDNPSLDGPKSVQLRTWIRAHGTSVRLAEGGGANLTVTDDDGPALQLVVDRSLVASGSNPAATATVTRNAGTNSALTVTLSSSKPTNLTAPPFVTLPVGAVSASVPLISPINAALDGNHSLTVTASAAGFAPGVAQLVVSDLDLPDLVVSSISAPDSADTEAFVNLGYQLRNQGSGGMASNTLGQRIFLSRDPVLGDDVLVGEYSFRGPLPAGGHFGQTFSVRLPQAAGDYWVIVMADTENAVSEILEDNNTRVSTTPLHVNAAYHAVVTSSLESAPAGTSVPLTGRAFRPSTGVPVPFVLVNVHLQIRGTRRILSALTDAAGNFSIVWQPLPGEAGFYEIAAAHPGDLASPPQDSFSLHGFAAVPGALTVQVPERSSTTHLITLLNSGDQPLHGMTAVVVDNPAGVPVTLTLQTNQLAGLGANSLRCVIEAPEAFGPEARFVVRLTSSEGAVVNVPVQVDVQELLPRLVALPTDLVAGMRRGVQTLVGLRVVNVGGTATGPMAITLPSAPWLTLASPNPQPSIEPGATNTITLRLAPSADLALGTYPGSVHLNAGGTSLRVPFEFRALSDSKGDLRITAEDEYTYYAEGSPRLAQAIVTVRDAISREVLAQGPTALNGQFTAAQLPEGYYDVELTADQHANFKGTYRVRPGETQEVTAFLSRQTVRYSWTVVPTEIEDRYRIVVETEFEANVPAPVVTIEPSVIDLADMPGDEWQVDLTIQNHGLIAAQDFQLEFDSHPLYTFTPLIRHLGVLPARSTFTVPLTIRRFTERSASRAHQPPPTARDHAQPAGRAQRQSVTGISCTASGRGVHTVKCGLIDTTQLTPLTFPNALACDGPPTGPGGGGGSGGGGGGGGGGGSSANRGKTNTEQTASGKGRRFDISDILSDLAEIVPNLPSLSLPSVCDPCFQKRLAAAAACAIDFLPLPPPDAQKCLRNSLDCVKGNIQEGLTVGNATGCASVLLDCSNVGKALAKKIPLLGQLLTAIDCADSLCNACEGLPGHSGLCGRSTNTSTLSRPGTARLLSAGGSSAAQVEAARFAGVGDPVLGPLLLQADRMARVLAPYRYYFGNDAWLRVADSDALQSLLDQFGQGILPSSPEEQFISPAERAGLQNLPLPTPLTSADLNAFLDRWNRSVSNYAAGIFRRDQAGAGQTDFFALDEWQEVLEASTAELQAYIEEGVTDITTHWRAAIEEFVTNAHGGSGGVCAKVRLRLEQQAVITRDAFRATLEIENSTGSELESVAVDLHITNLAGQESAARFGILPPALAGISGVLGEGRIATGATGQVAWTLIPANDAAPSESVEYLVSGTLRYRQDGILITVPLAASAITVLPSPRLTVRYFHERDVFGDDPHTEVIEPSVPFNLGVLVQNTGAGSARNFRITSAQPQIVENEKGLLIDFKIIATEVAGQNLTPTLTADLGFIAPGTNAIARWLMTSTLQGLFTDYHATFAHIDGLGNPKLSLIDTVEIHEMNRLVQAGGSFEDGRPDFLVNDIPDLRDDPDTLWLSDGSTQPVEVVNLGSVQGTLSPGNLAVQLNAALPGGWTLLQIPDPGNGRYRLIRVIRSDQVILAVNTNVWVTDRTFKGLGKRPVLENTLHLLDYNSPGSYTLVYEPLPASDTESPVSMVTTLPTASRPNFPVTVSGQDNTGGQGIAHYDIYVSEDRGPFQRWLTGTTDASTLYPGTLGHRYAFYSVAVDRAGNREAAPATADAFTTVTRTNQPPEFLPPKDVVLTEGQTLSLQLAATDPDDDALTYSLLASPPGLLILPASGQLTWNTGEGDGPGTNQITVRVLDNGEPRLGITRSFRVVVTDDNAPPQLPPIADRAINEGQLLSLESPASDTDLPPQTLSYRLAAGAPIGVTVNATTGLITWRPTDAQGGTTNRLSLIVTDTGVPPLSATQTFTVIVRDTRPDFSLRLGTTHLRSGDSARVPMLLRSGTDLTDVSFDLLIGGDRLTQLSLQALAPEVSLADLVPLGSNRFNVRFRSRADTVLQGELTLAQLALDTAPQEHSAIATLAAEELAGLRGSSVLPVNGQTDAGRVFIIGNEPILEVGGRGPDGLALIVYALPGRRYVLERRDSLETSLNWNEATALDIEQLRTALLPLPMNGAEGTEFFRVRPTTSPLGVALMLSYQNEGVVIEWPAECPACRLEETPVLKSDAHWTPTPATRAQMGSRFRVVLPAGEAQRFFRLIAR